MKIKQVVFIALLAAALCALSPFCIYIGAVPVSLSLFAVCLAGLVGGAKIGTCAVGIYILLGAVGLPVFAGFLGGAQCIVGATGGYIVGYLPCAFIVGRLAEGAEKPLRSAGAMTLGTLVCYIVGTVWFMLYSRCGFMQALAVCVLPFAVFDGIKIALAAVLGKRICAALKTVR